MTASFQVTLDTVTHLTAAINGGNPSTENTTVTLELGLDPDAVLVKIWGDINILDPANAGMGETEEGAEWLPAEADFLVALTTNRAKKTLHVRVQDDVGNEATAAASIQIGELPAPPPTPTPAPQHPEVLPAGGLPRPGPDRRQRRLVLAASPAGRVRDRASIRTRRSPSSPVPAVSTMRRSRMSHTSSSQQPSTPVRSSVQARSSRVVARRPERDPPAPTVQRRDGPEFVAALEALGIL